MSPGPRGSVGKRLAAFLPPDRADALLADLDEEFTERASSTGTAAAERW
jgi:DNA-binding IclR family transcriptional regulator